MILIFPPPPPLPKKTLATSLNVEKDPPEAPGGGGGETYLTYLSSTSPNFPIVSHGYLSIEKERLRGRGIIDIGCLLFPCGGGWGTLARNLFWEGGLGVLEGNVEVPFIEGIRVLDCGSRA